jgi:acetyltransferase-like isoleucine patch superfamily enzyme
VPFRDAYCETTQMAPRDFSADGTYRPAEYLQFKRGLAVRISMALIGALSWPLTVPMALLSRFSDIVFRTFSELLALIPYFPGVIVRYEFYRFALRSCGHNVLVESGAVFIYRDVIVGHDVLIGRGCIIHHADIGDYVLLGERCTLLSGSRQHSHSRTDVPIALQGGHKRRIAIGSDTWIGSHAVVMADVASGAIVAAGAVVVQAVGTFEIVGGVPARAIGRRDVHGSVAGPVQ